MRIISFAKTVSSSRFRHLSGDGIWTLHSSPVLLLLTQTCLVLNPCIEGSDLLEVIEHHSKFQEIISVNIAAALYIKSQAVSFIHRVRAAPTDTYHLIWAVLSPAVTPAPRLCLTELPSTAGAAAAVAVVVAAVADGCVGCETDGAADGGPVSAVLYRCLPVLPLLRRLLFDLTETAGR